MLSCLFVEAPSKFGGRPYEVLERGAVPNDQLGITIGDKRYRARRFSLSARPAHPERHRSLHSENDSAPKRRRFWHTERWQPPKGATVSIPKAIENPKFTALIILPI